MTVKTDQPNKDDAQEQPPDNLFWHIIKAVFIPFVILSVLFLLVLLSVHFLQ